MSSKKINVKAYVLALIGVLLVETKVTNSS